MISMVQWSLKIFILLLSTVFGSELAQYAEGDLCTLPSSETNGTCKLFHLCPSAIQNSKTILPKSCGFKNNIPIVCCADDSVPISTEEAKPTPTTKGASTDASVLEVGDKSKLKCQEYGKYFTTPVSEDLPQMYCLMTEEDKILIPELSGSKKFPHMALIGYDDDDNTTLWACSGSLISEKFVLLPAHCSYSPHFGEPKRILLGGLVLDSTTDVAQKLSIKRIIVHPNYRRPSRYHDIALIELEHNAVLNAYVRPACLNTNPNLTNELGSATGWEKLSTYGEEPIEMLGVRLNILTNTECNNTYHKKLGQTLTKGIVEETQLCTKFQYPERNCQVNIEGPLQIIHQDVFCMYKIIGTTSFGFSCGTNTPLVYTKVSAYIKWIEDIVWP